MMARLCYLTNFLLAVSLGVGFIFMADVQDKYGLKDWEIGGVVAAGFVAALVTQLLLAPLADRGRVLVLARISIVASVVGAIGFAYADHVVTLVLSRGLVGVGLGLFSVSARKALLGMDAKGGGKKVGALLSTGVGGFVSGPVIGLQLGEISFAAPFLVTGVAIAVVGPLALRQIAKAPIASAPVDYSDIGSLLHRPRVQIAMMVQAIVFGFIGVFDAIVDRYLTDLGASGLATSVVILAAGIPLLVLPTRLGALGERLGGTRVLIPGVLVALVTITLFGLAGSPTAVGAVAMFQGISESAMVMGAQVLILEATGARRAAIGSAIMETVGLGTATITSVLAPVVYGAHGARILFGGYAFLSALVAVVMLLRIRSLGSTLPDPDADSSIQDLTLSGVD